MKIDDLNEPGDLELDPNSIKDYSDCYHIISKEISSLLLEYKKASTHCVQLKRASMNVPEEQDLYEEAVDALDNFLNNVDMNIGSNYFENALNKVDDHVSEFMSCYNDLHDTYSKLYFRCKKYEKIIETLEPLIKYLKGSTDGSD